MHTIAISIRTDFLRVLTISARLASTGAIVASTAAIGRFVILRARRVAGLEGGALDSGVRVSVDTVRRLGRYAEL